MSVWLSLALVLFTSVAPAADDSPYNKGVDAWRAKNFVEARRQWELSLAQGGPDESLNNLGFLLYHGLGGSADQHRAVTLWKKGAALAVSEAQLNLGRAYEQGGGVAPDRAQAYAWYKCAVATATRRSDGDVTEKLVRQDAEAELARLVALLTPQERATGERLAVGYVVRYASPLASGKP